jgi:thiopeptide-type bacteriocin biosynthesis protein
MANLEVNSFLLVRSPSYSYTEYNKSKLIEVLHTDFFQASLFAASQDFYKELEKRKFIYDELSIDLKTTLWKYYNRMCFRPTPYGLFSSYSNITWEEQNKRMYIASNGIANIDPDFKFTYSQVKALEISKFSSLLYFQNSSIYKVLDKLRYLSQSQTKDPGFWIMEIQNDSKIRKFLKGLRFGKTRSQIIEDLNNLWPDVPACGLFDSLNKGQLIVSEFFPNVTGISYAQRCFSILKDDYSIQADNLKSFTIDINSHKHSLKPLMRMISHFWKNGVSQTYSLYHRRITGGLSKEMQTDLLSIIRGLDKISVNRGIDIMNDFKQQFMRKFDQQEISLLLALDPEYGVGYKNLTSRIDDISEEMIAELKPEQNESISNIQWGAVEQIILSKWTSNDFKNSGKIVITSEDLQSLPQPSNILPPGLFVLFKKVDKQIWIDNVGGVSGVELTSRFSKDEVEILNSIQAICKKEEEINNDFVFADIAFSPNNKSSNILQRGHLYSYEIPILTHSTRPIDQVIDLDDIRVSIRDNAVFLRSHRLNKYIIPRLSSAYNYHLSTNAIFRFLCDLQFQGVNSDLTFSLMGRFPDMSFYPRVELENAVISPATWVLVGNKIHDLERDPKAYLSRLKVSDHFSFQENDNFLVFNKNKEEELTVFLKCIKNKPKVILTEYIYPTEPNLFNSEGLPHANQIVACVTNNEKSYRMPNVKPTKPLVKSKVRRIFLAGEEWLYIRIYMHYTLADEFLLRVVSPILHRYKQKSSQVRWFFIRYNEGGDHIRLRLFGSKEMLFKLWDLLMQRFRPLIISGQIDNVLVDTYKREIEKFSPELIGDVEALFCSNSEYVLKVLSLSKRDTPFKISFAVNSTLKIGKALFENATEFKCFLSDVLNDILSEKENKKEIKRKLDSQYRKYRHLLITPDTDNIIKGAKQEYSLFNSNLEEIAIKAASCDRATNRNLAINIIHLHINRIFETNQQQFECLSYHFMFKHLLYLTHSKSGDFL